MTPFIVVFVTVASAEEGKKIAHVLVEEKLAACANIVPGLTSIYRWNGKIESSEEQLLIIKSSQDKFPDIKKRVRAVHSYETPEIIALPITDGCGDYLRWLGDSLK